MTWLLVAILVVVLAAGAIALYLIVSERRRHELVEAEYARLLADEKERDAERARLSEQLITAEQDERRRLAVFLHEGPVQSLSGIGLMLDAALHSLDEGRVDEGCGIIVNALEKHRDTIRSLRELSFNLEPVVLRDEGFGPAVRALADRLGISHGIQFDLDVDAGAQLAEKAQVGLYQIIREAVLQSIRRGPPTRIGVRIERTNDGQIATVITDDGAGERRRASFEAIAERARTLNGQFDVDQSDGGTSLSVVLPGYVAGS